MSNAPQLPGETGGFRGLPGASTGDAPVVDTSPRRGQASQQIIVVVLLLSVSGAAIFGMRHLGARAGMDMTVTEIGLKIGDEKESAERAKSYERIMADLQRMQRPLDVAMGDFQKSPFMLDMPEQPVATNVEDEELKRAEQARREAAARRDATLRTLGGLQLQSVLGGSKPLARINNETVHVGDKVGGSFVVKEIRGREREVVLDNDGEDFVLSMNLPMGGAPTQAPAPHAATPKSVPAPKK
jgi:hypothetical protein